MGNECTSSSTFPGATSSQLVNVFKQGWEKMDNAQLQKPTHTDFFSWE